MVPVPPLIAVMLGVIGAALVVRYFAQEWRRANADLEKAKDSPLTESQSEPVRKLRRDPDGTFRP